MTDRRRCRRRVAPLALALGVTVLCSLVLALAGAGSAHARTVWLCHPGIAHDPCRPGLSTTVYSPTLHARRTTSPRRRRPLFDCFYVYPTVSDQPTTLADRRIDPEERSIALYQAARYSQSCRVYAPMYRQVTLAALASGNHESPAQLATPVRDVTAAFRAYLRGVGPTRPFVLIGHSQGAFVLEQMIRDVIDRDPALRARMLSAVLLGGNVTVPDGRDVGGSFRHVPACHAVDDLNCVIAFSTYDEPPPADSLFGRTSTRGRHVLCVNPAALRDQTDRIVDPILPSAPFAPGTLIAAGISLLHIVQPHPPTVWSSLPGAYAARCSRAGGADVLRIAPRDGAQLPAPSPDPTWGLHLLDANVELGNLLATVDEQAENYVDMLYSHARRGDRDARSR